MDIRTVHLFLPHGMADWEPGYAVAGIQDPDYQVNPGRYQVRTVGPTASPVTTMGGIRILPDLALSELRPEDSAMLILPGAASWEGGAHGDAAELAGEFLAAGVPVAAICGATAGLARKGLLDRRPHTSNDPDFLRRVPGYSGGEHYVATPSLLAGDLITATGIAPVDFARDIFQRLELYPAPVLAAWYTLQTTGDPSAFAALEGGGEG